MTSSFPKNPKIPTRICKKCGEEKMLVEFYPANKTNTFQGSCKECCKKNAKKLISDQLAKSHPCDFKFHGRL